MLGVQLKEYIYIFILFWFNCISKNEVKQLYHVKLITTKNILYVSTFKIHSFIFILKSVNYTAKDLIYLLYYSKYKVKQ